MEPPAEDDMPGTVSIVLEHRDPGLSLPLFRATDGVDIVAEWQSWARVLGVPLLVAEADGRLREPVQPYRRRCRRGCRCTTTPAFRDQEAAADATVAARPRRDGGTPVVHHDEREIIARN